MPKGQYKRCCVRNCRFKTVTETSRFCARHENLKPTSEPEPAIARVVREPVVSLETRIRRMVREEMRKELLHFRIHLSTGIEPMEALKHMGARLRDET